MNVYLDNAATTAPYSEVLETITPYFTEIYGNPSSLHAIGRKARASVELARKSIASEIGATSAEIIFTSGGTEANNIFLQGIASSVPCIISSPLEHPSVLQVLKKIAKEKICTIVWLEIDSHGIISLDNLRSAVEEHPGALVALMHGNNEVGNLLPLETVAKICTDNNALFFSDTVQTIGHYPINVKSLNITGLAASAHKFHGPKGVGFLYLKQGAKLSPIYQGGEQERGVRIGTENVIGIVGMASALEISCERIQYNREQILQLKTKLIEQLTKFFPDILFNGSSGNTEDSMHTILSASFPEHDQNEMLLFNLDLNNIAVSAGSACASGASKESHVLEALGHNPDRATIRFSFSYKNTFEEIYYVIEKLREIFQHS